jgi:hypothetical protein
MTEAEQEELKFLRFFYSYIKGLMSQAGTDEVYWAIEAYTEKTDKDPPAGY